jgi:hypothetical protein
MMHDNFVRPTDVTELHHPTRKQVVNLYSKMAPQRAAPGLARGEVSMPISHIRMIVQFQQSCTSKNKLNSVGRQQPLDPDKAAKVAWKLWRLRIRRWRQSCTGSWWHSYYQSCSQRSMTLSSNVWSSCISGNGWLLRSTAQI